MMHINEKIVILRELMKQKGIQAYIISSNDPHMSKYVSEHWKSRAYFSGFTGSAGTLVVTQSEIGLWTDGRYYIQATEQLEGSEIQLFRMGQKGVPSYIQYLLQKLQATNVVGIDGKLFSAKTVQVMKNILKQKDITINTTLDLVAPIWQDRPKVTLTTIYRHELEYTGLETSDKLIQVRKQMKDKQVEGYVISDLASIAWLFNIRASDIVYNPMAVAYAYITKEKAYLCIDSSRMPLAVQVKLKSQKVDIKTYESIEQILIEIQEPMKVLCCTSNLNVYLYDLLNKNRWVNIVEGEDLIAGLKAVKNKVEIQNIRKAHIKDGCALVHFMVDFEKRRMTGPLTEYDLIEMLQSARNRQPNNKGESFASIVAYKENAAKMHYVPTMESHKVLKKEGLLLIDSGGQYLEGTTDITRTFALGPITEEQKLHYTLVLKAHINVARAIFMKGCTGGNLDILARGPIWAYGLDYKCGTGHGVGFMLGVHEGPQGLNMSNQVPLKKGMLLTNEPGIYIKGSHGIRIENILLVTDYKTTEDGVFYHFENLTYFPIDLEPINQDLLNKEEIKWINDYHQNVYKQLSPHLKGEALKWLEVHTRMI